jgi:hypothetical protein
MCFPGAWGCAVDLPDLAPLRAAGPIAWCSQLAARQALNLSAAAFSAREDELHSLALPPPSPSVIRSEWVQRLILD